MASETKKYGFLFCVGAEQELARLCPGNDLSRMGETLTRKDADAIELSVELICILSRWYEKARAFETGEEERRPLTRDELLLLPLPAFKRLQDEALAAMLRDAKQSVEVDPQKKGKAPKSS